jgi:hypothetical protein
MSPENEARLCRDFPALYGTEYAFACPDSWIELLHRLSRDLTDHARQAGLTLTVTDVKEKHGSLHFYMDGGDDIADHLVDVAEEASFAIDSGSR